MSGKDYTAMLLHLVNKGRMNIDECRRMEAEFERAKRGSGFWSSWMITAAICALCFGSYMVGVIVGMHQGAAVQKAIVEAGASY
jgi:hypothetical protein